MSYLNKLKSSLLLISCLFCGMEVFAQGADKVDTEVMVAEVAVNSPSVFERAWDSGFVIFSVLSILVAFSVLSWAIFITKYLYLKRLNSTNKSFVKKFWDSKSLNELNSKLADYPASPAKEIFKMGYGELARGSQLKEQTANTSLAVHAAIENIGRTLKKARRSERKKMEKYLPFLAIIASSSPFIGLFGTVWGIMGAFEGIARTGSSSLAAVAPGISEALIATAFGLAAAIPAVIGYNAAQSMIGSMSIKNEGFSTDFLNIVERYLVADKKTSNKTL